MELLRNIIKIITKSGISLNAGTLIWGFTVPGKLLPHPAMDWGLNVHMLRGQ
jgi:hypothetical protein